jgi:hypothetical protein
MEQIPLNGLTLLGCTAYWPREIDRSPFPIKNALR